MSKVWWARFDTQGRKSSKRNCPPQIYTLFKEPKRGRAKSYILCSIATKKITEGKGEKWGDGEGGGEWGMGRNVGDRGMGGGRTVGNGGMGEWGCRSVGGNGGGRE